MTGAEIAEWFGYMLGAFSLGYAAHHSILTFRKVGDAVT